RPQLGAERKRAPGVVDPDLAVMRIGLDERRMPVRLAMVSDRVHHERVDVGKLQTRVLHRRRDCALLAVEQARRPGVGRSGLVEGAFQIGVGAEGKSHHDALILAQYSVSRSNCLKKSFSMTPSGLLKKQAR